jgi:hypothetical protein
VNVAFSKLLHERKGPSVNVRLTAYTVRQQSEDPPNYCLLIKLNAAILVYQMFDEEETD